MGLYPRLHKNMHACFKGHFAIALFLCYFGIVIFIRMVYDKLNAFLGYFLTSQNLLYGEW